MALKEVVFINYFEVFSFLWGCATSTAVTSSIYAKFIQETICFLICQELLSFLHFE